MAFHSKPLEHFILKHPAGATTAFFVMLVVAVAALILAVLIWRACKIEKARLSCELINQMESTSRAERRSRSKSTAFTDASHEIRGPLALLITYIDLCYDLVPSGSDVEDNLRKMHTCANNLLKLLNTILDISKVEAGKMELEDDEFNLVELMETVADLYHPTAMKKGVEVVLDLCDGSVLKYANVRGDKTRLQQIISNLVSNAVKFTPKGSISIRVWARKPSPEPCCMLVSHHQSNWLNWLLSRMFCKDNGVEDTSTTSQQNPDCMEYIIEVDDTGVGIPKDKQKSVFENFFQVKENSACHLGTGLGLGIVQSLVRLMGGDIGVVDKGPGREGTCFQFNIFLDACNNQQTAGPDERMEEADIEAPAESSYEIEMVSAFDEPLRHQEVDGSSLVVLLIHNNERRRVVKRYLERVGINVSMVKHWEYLQGHMRRIKSTLLTQTQNSTMSDWTSSQSDCMSVRSATRKYNAKEVPLSSLDGTDHVVARSRVNKGAPTFILFLIDAGAGPFEEMAAVVEEFRNDQSCYNVNSKAVWLEKPGELCNGLVERLRSEDVILSKPLHGSRLHQIARLLPEFGGISTLRTIGKLGIDHQNSEIGNKEAECNTSGSEEILTMRERQARRADQKKVVCREMRAAGLMSGDW
ncbi:unnamed protein product [Rhodiola kirilowii]